MSSLHTQVTASVSEEYRAELLRVQQTRTLSEEAGEFRSYLVQQGVVEETVKVLLGLLEADDEDRPEDGRAFLKAYFDAKQLDPFVQTSPKVDIEAMVDENEKLRADHDRLASQVNELTALWADKQLSLWAPHLDRLIAAFTVDGQEGLVDMVALHAAARAAMHAAAPADDADADAGARPEDEPQTCTDGLVRDWALDEFGDAEPGSAESLEAFVRLLLPADAPASAEGESEAAPPATAEPRAAVEKVERLLRDAAEAEEQAAEEEAAEAEAAALAAEERRAMAADAEADGSAAVDGSAT